MAKYRCIKVTNGNNKVWYEVQKKFWFAWVTVRESSEHTPSRYSTVIFFGTQTEAEVYIKKKKRNKSINRQVVSCFD